MDLGLLIIRTVLGAFVAAHGVQKLTYMWGGGGLDAAAAEFSADGFRGGRATAVLAGGTQVAAGLAMVGGLLTPAASAGILGVMATATGVKLRAGFWSQDGGFEYPLFLAILAVATAWAGPGRYSLDQLAGLIGWWTPAVSAAATVVGIGSALVLRIALYRAASADAPTTPNPTGRPA
jgi:putative oxidoreductase